MGESNRALNGEVVVQGRNDLLKKGRGQSRGGRGISVLDVGSMPKAVKGPGWM